MYNARCNNCYKTYPTRIRPNRFDRLRTHGTGILFAKREIEGVRGTGMHTRYTTRALGFTAPTTLTHMTCRVRHAFLTARNTSIVSALCARDAVLAWAGFPATPVAT